MMEIGTLNIYLYIVNVTQYWIHNWFKIETHVQINNDGWMYLKHKYPSFCPLLEDNSGFYE